MGTTSKGKRKNVHRGCFISIGILLLVPILCFASMWLFARYGGEWATSRSIPIPDSSIFQVAIHEHGFYSKRISFYTHVSSPEILREWFIDAGIPLSPIPLNLEGTSFIENDNYYHPPPLFNMQSPLDELHDLSARYTTGWWSDFTKSCHSVRVYKNNDAVAHDYPEVDLSAAEDTIFVIITCWANVE